MTKFTKKQLNLVVEVMILAFIDTIQEKIDGIKDDAFHYKRSISLEQRSWVISCKDEALEYLGWNLSILYAQITDDGMGTYDAVSVIGLEDTLDNWFQTTLNKPRLNAGEIGNIYRDIDVKEISKKWVNEVFFSIATKG
jgi:hypothetical protein